MNFNEAALKLHEEHHGKIEVTSKVPVVLGKNGIEKIIEVKLDKDEQELLAQSAKAVRSVMDVLDNMKLF